MQWQLGQRRSLGQIPKKKPAAPPTKCPKKDTKSKAAMMVVGMACLISWCKGTGHSMVECKIFLGQAPSMWPASSTSDAWNASVMAMS
jgi:hypothetical protein